MNITTIEDELAEVRLRIGRMQERAQAGVAADVEAELRSWDTYLERLQTGVAADAWKTREQAEAAIADVRGRRIAVEERLAQACDGFGEGGHEHRERVTAARDELAQKAHHLPTKFN